jgi:hypothetical protein
VSGIHAVRVAARMRRELGIEVDMIKGHYGEYTVLVDNEPLIDGGPLVILGVMPAARKIVDAVKTKLGE